MSGQTADMIADFDTHVPARPSKQRRSDAALPVSGTCSAPRQRCPSSTSNLNAEKMFGHDSAKSPAEKLSQ